uniref:Beta-microseminoprotein n=1 Tax=Sarcophilus harrisii TaxID=9305 RepID=G3VGM4_SARHA
VFLSILLALAIFVTLCDTTCYMIPLDITSESNQKDNDNIIHEFDMKWKSHCEICSCHQEIGIHCCNKGLLRTLLILALSSTNRTCVPLSYDKIRCKEIFDIISCHYKAVKKANPKYILYSL